jgi:tetratricopeptide (TPR) repeat protein
MIPLITILLFSDSLTLKYLELGEIDSVEARCKKLSSCSPFILGEVAYFQHKFKKALNLYVKVKHQNKFAKTALMRRMIIKESRKEELRKYVEAELLIRKGKTKEGKEILTNLMKNKGNISGWSVLLLIEVLKKEKNYKKIITFISSFLKQNPTSIKIPFVKLELARVYKWLGNTKKAEKIYKEIMIEFPNSPVASIAKEEKEGL